MSHKSSIFMAHIFCVFYYCNIECVNFFQMDIISNIHHLFCSFIRDRWD